MALNSTIDYFIDTLTVNLISFRSFEGEISIITKKSLTTRSYGSSYNIVTYATCYCMGNLRKL